MELRSPIEKVTHEDFFDLLLDAEEDSTVH